MHHGRGLFRYDPARHSVTKPMGGSDFIVGARFALGRMFAEGKATLGKFGGLAVFKRALSDEEIRKLHESAGLATLNDLK